ncbi:hypothetical protein [Geminisphaera colitermitum]|uniref:hypothetical protein n=1 Tax=Geminisphaera colitermitum TaxID=1148786 RepID=UPI000196535E|nr:hypothetical protein [Geminisphaera colitermitum]
MLSKSEPHKQPHDAALQSLANSQVCVTQRHIQQVEQISLSPPFPPRRMTKLTATTVVLTATQR